MKERINLSLDSGIIKQARLEAAARGCTVSEIVEGLLLEHIVGLEKLPKAERSGMFKIYSKEEWERMHKEALAKRMKQQEEGKAK